MAGMHLAGGHFCAGRDFCAACMMTAESPEGTLRSCLLRVCLLLVLGLTCAMQSDFGRAATTSPESPLSGNAQESKGKLTVFNAGSLTASMADLLREFARLHPGVEPEQESSGSLDAVRKITELGKPCDVLALADYEVIASLMVPQYADWYALFARNQMVVMYTDKSKFAGEITSANWHEILLRSGVQAAHSDPDADPAGYRTLLLWQLSEKYYQQPGLYKRLYAAVPLKNIRPKSVELVALLQSGEVDYVYGYRSIAEQNKLRFVSLPPEVDLSDMNKSNLYATATVEVAGKKPGEKVKIEGLPILFALTIPKAAPHPALAEEFLRFMFSPVGQQIMKKNYLTLVLPPLASGIEKAPAGLRGEFVALGQGDEPKKK
jgi:molybdate/tungstate transport system substrate-binding protein